MKTLYLDCGMGAAGDMLSAALYELLDESQKNEYISKMNSIGIENVDISAENMTKCGIVGTHIKVAVGGIEEDEILGAHSHEHEHSHNHEHDHDHNHEHSHEHDHDHNHNHEHSHDHEHSHHHSSLGNVEQIIGSLSVSDAVKENAISVYKLIAEAESHAHGKPVSDIHFHEVGTMDAIADVTSVCLLIEMLGVDNILATPVHVGSGHVRCAHGILPVPAPATAFILKDVPIYGGGIKGELCTPTGAALLKHFVSDFGDMPAMRVSKIGYGMGKKDFACANCVRAMLGETSDSRKPVIELTCNVDDMTPELVGFAMERLFDAGALEVFTVPVGMKKSRPGTMICVMCKEDDRERIIREIFKHTTTLGVRENISQRYTLNRNIEKEKTYFGDVRVKTSEGYGITRKKYEYEDLARIARDENLSISEVVRMIDNAGK